MGKKSDKKVKSDRINVLRKQYDSFLEEDKKRKDRNEYILGKLDKMRYSTTAIQLRHKPNLYGDLFSSSNTRQTYRSDDAERNDTRMVPVNHQIARSYQSLPPDVPRNLIEESSLLKEISKKYILIPKLRTMYPNDYAEVIPPQISAPTPLAKPEDIDNNDWKSKYDILDQLKLKEKEEEIKFTNNNQETTHKCNLDIPKESDHVVQNYKSDDLPIRYEEEIPEKDVSDQLVVENELKSLEKFTINENKDETPIYDDTHPKNYYSVDPVNVATYYDDTTTKVVIDRDVNENVENKYRPEQYDIPPEQEVKGGALIDTHVDAENQEKEYLEQEFQQPQNYPVEYEQMPVTEADTNFVDPEAYLEQAENEYSPIEVINPTELVQEINHDSAAQETAVTEHQYPIEIINTPDFTPDETVILQDGENVNPNYETNDVTFVQENTAPQILAGNLPVDNSGIEEFDFEQQNMFYSEQTDQNYTYDQQQGAGDVYHQNYNQDENYPQSQEYAYYEGANAAEQEAYPVEINEHEETQQNYDQNYEQQYTTNYETTYEQNQVYMEQDPTQQQFEEPAIYDKAQQEFDQYNFDQAQESKEQVEQVLDGEDGYTTKQKVEEETDGGPEKLGGRAVEENAS